MNEVRKIKGLKSQLKNLKTDCDVLANEIKIKQKDLANKRSIMKSLQSTVNELK